MFCMSEKTRYMGGKLDDFIHIIMYCCRIDFFLRMIVLRCDPEFLVRALDNSRKHDMFQVGFL